MELTQMRYFQVVAKHQHMTRAAEELNVSQPALSAMIARLEGELGVKLFERKGRSIVLNSFGSHFSKRINHILMETDNLKSELTNMADKSKQIISVIVTSPQFFPGVSHFVQENRELKLNLSVAPAAHIVQSLREGNSDFAIVSPGIYDDTFSGELLLRDRFVVAVHPEHPLAKKQSITIDELSKENWIMLQKGLPFRTQTDELFSEMGIVPNISIECDHYLRKELINANAGITIASSSAQFRHLYAPNICYLEIEGYTKYREIVMVHSKEKYLSPHVRKVMSYIKSHYQDYTFTYSL